MATDIRGSEVRVGDRVTIEFEVLTAIGDNFANNLLLRPVVASPERQPDFFFHSRQVLVVMADGVTESPAVAEEWAPQRRAIWMPSVRAAPEPVPEPSPERVAETPGKRAGRISPHPHA